MENEESVPAPESECTKVDVLVVLGRNFLPGFDHKVLAEQRFHLSPVSRINTLAAGLMYKAGLTNTLIFSSGHTAGSNVPSEAEAMKKYLQRIFKDIPDEAIILEDISIDTESNAKEVKTIVDQHPEFQTLGLLTDTTHLDRAVSLFQGAGMNVSPFDSLKILHEKRPDMVERYIHSQLYKKTARRDKQAALIQSLPVIAPIASWMLHKLAEFSRKPDKPNPYIPDTSS